MTINITEKIQTLRDNRTRLEAMVLSAVHDLLQLDLENTYFLLKRPDFVQLLERDMRNFNESVRDITESE